MTEPRPTGLQRLAATLDQIDARLAEVSAFAAQASATLQRVDARATSYLAALVGWGGNLANVRGTLRGLAAKRYKDFEFVASIDYAETALGLAGALPTDAAGGALKLAGTLLLLGPQSTSRAPEDIFGPDQLGVRVPVQLSYFGTTHDLSLHFAVGFRLSTDGVSLFLAHNARLVPSVGNDVPAAILGAIEREIDRKLRMSFKDRRTVLPTFPLKRAKVVNMLCVRVGAHVSAPGRVVTVGSDVIEIVMHPPLVPLAALPAGVDHAARIAADEVISLVHDAILAELRGQNVWITGGSWIVQEDPDSHSSRVVFLMSASTKYSWCKRWEIRWQGIATHFECTEPTVETLTLPFAPTARFVSLKVGNDVTVSIQGYVGKKPVSEQKVMTIKNAMRGDVVLHRDSLEVFVTFAH